MKYYGWKKKHIKTVVFPSSIPRSGHQVLSAQNDIIIFVWNSFFIVRRRKHIWTLKHHFTIIISHNQAFWLNCTRARRDRWVSEAERILLRIVEEESDLEVSGDQMEEHHQSTSVGGGWNGEKLHQSPLWIRSVVWALKACEGNNLLIYTGFMVWTDWGSLVTLCSTEISTSGGHYSFSPYQRHQGH